MRRAPLANTNTPTGAQVPDFVFEKVPEPLPQVRWYCTHTGCPTEYYGAEDTFNDLIQAHLAWHANPEQSRVVESTPEEG